MAAWGWLRSLEVVFHENARAEFPNLSRLLNSIDARPAAQRALALMRKHPFNDELAQAALDNLFPHRRAVSTAAT